MKSITYVAPHKTALTIAIVFALSSLLFIIPMMMFSFMPATDHNGNTINSGVPVVMMMIMPVFYFIFGYLFTGLSALIYNKVARFTGGVKVEITE